MIEKYLIGILTIPAIMIGWVGIQRLWSKVFTEHPHDGDVLAGRSDCGSCGCATPCSVKSFKNNKTKM
ncbi:MAG: hypothetical protein RLO17_14455 [Cyclobacteriaceae bacterium]